MHGHEAKRLVGLCSSKLLLSTKYSLKIYCSAVGVLAAAGFSLVRDLLDPMIINISAFQCNKRETMYVLMRRTLCCNLNLLIGGRYKIQLLFVWDA